MESSREVVSFFKIVVDILNYPPTLGVVTNTNQTQNMIIEKFTNGYVKQTFDQDGKFLSQGDFVATDGVEFENEDGEPIDVDPAKFYHSFDFQKDSIKKHIEIIKELAESEDSDKEVEILRVCDKILDRL